MFLPLGAALAAALICAQPAMAGSETTGTGWQVAQADGHGMAAHGQDWTHGDLTIRGAFARATAPAARAGAAYLTISNEGESDDRLVAATAEVSTEAQLHRTEMVDNVMRMREIEGGIAIPSGASVALAPGGAHIMLLGLAGPLVEGEHIALTLEFERGGVVEITARIGGIAAEAPHHHGE